MFLNKNKILLIKRESVYGTDPVPTVSENAIEAKNIKIEYNGDLLERDLVRSTLSNSAPIMGQRWAELSFQVEIKGSGTKGTAGRIGDALVACGLTETAAAGSSVTYTPCDSTFLSATAYLYELQDTGNCKLHKITGCRGTVSFDFEAGKIATAEIKLQGLIDEISDESEPSAPTYETTKPPIVENSTFTLNGVTSLIAQAVKIDMANEVVKQDDISSATGLKGFLITGRKPAGSINPEAVLKATYDFVGDWQAATERALSLVLGSAAGNKLTVTAPKLVLEKVGAGERSGIRTEDLAFRLALNAGGDELVLKFE